LDAACYLNFYQPSAVQNCDLHHHYTNCCAQIALAQGSWAVSVPEGRRTARNKGATYNGKRFIAPLH